MAEIVDIEQLAVWAYRDQAVERMTAAIFAAVGRRGPAGIGAGTLGTIAGLGVRVDGGGWRGGGPGSVASASAVADDALTLHEAVLALPAMLMEIGADGAIRLTWQDEFAAAGLRERSDGALVRDGVVVLGETIEPAILIITNARNAERPDVVDDFVADFSERPRDSSGRWIADRDAYRRSLDDVIRMRGLYAAWRAGLVRVADRLAGKLEAHQITGPAASPAPWDVPRMAETRRGPVDVNALS
jgi:hypothetical protein